MTAPVRVIGDRVGDKDVPDDVGSATVAGVEGAAAETGAAVAEVGVGVELTGAKVAGMLGSG